MAVVVSYAATIAVAGEESPCADWVRFWDPGSGASATAGPTTIAPDGSVYVAGRIGVDDDDIVLVKYDASGHPLWVTTYDGAGGGDDEPTDIEVTAEGVSIAAASLGVHGPQTVLLDYGADGTLLREHRTIGPDIPGFLQPQLAIGVDGRRVLGTDDGAGNAVVEAYAADGSPLFQTSFDLSGFAGVSALEVNDDLDVFVVMVEDFNRYLVYKLDAAGQEQWSHTEAFTGLVLGEAYLATIGTDVVVAGSGEPPCISPLARVWRHASDGTVRWIRELPDDCTFAVAVGLSAAPGGGVYLAARAELPKSFLAYLDADGEVSWVTEAGGDGDSVGFSSLATTPAGNAIVGASIAPEDAFWEFDVLVQSYDTAGALSWSAVLAGEFGDADFIHGVAAGADGSVAAVATVRQGVPFQNIATIGFQLCPGDLDGDFDVDLSDLATLLAAFDSCVGDGDYNPDADLDDSACVDLSDLAILLANFGS